MSRRILLADDESDLRMMLKSALELAGYEVEVAANAQEALARQRDEPADILITDIFMPHSDGFEAIAGFRAQFPRTKIIVVSGGGQFARGDYLASAALMGVDATFQKPLEIETLLDAVRSLAP